MKEMLLQTATVRSGIIVFMKNDENTRMADNQPAITISNRHLDSERSETPARRAGVYGVALGGWTRARRR